MPAVVPSSQSAFSIRWKPLEFARRHVVLASVDARVEVAEGLGHRLDPLVGDAGGGVERLRLLDVAGFDRGDERLRRGDQLGGVLLEVFAVLGDRFFDLRAVLGLAACR